MPAPTITFTGKRLASAARLALIGVSVNAVLAAVKISAGMAGHCYALIADGLESTLDIFSSLVIWAGLVMAARPPDATHPYGHGKAEPLAAVAVSIMVHPGRRSAWGAEHPRNRHAASCARRLTRSPCSSWWW